MATLERREQTPGKVTYRVRWWANDKQRSKSFKERDAARRFKAVLEGDLVNGSYIDPKAGTVTLSSFAHESLPALTLDVRPSTKARILSIYRVHIEPQFGHMPLTAITGAGIGDWMVRMGATHGPASVRKNVHVLRRVLDHAVNNGLLRANPAAAVRLPQEPRHEQKYLTHAQALHLAETIHPRFRAMVLVAVVGGLRFGEVVALQRQHISEFNNTIHVKRTAVEIGSSLTYGPPKTKSSVRVVTLPRSIMAELVTHMNTYGVDSPDTLVFTGQRGNAITRNNWYRHYWQPATTSAGMIGLRFHDLRHTFVALWVDLGRNPKEVSRAAGHSSVAFTLDRYGHLYETDHDGLADELDQLLGHVSTRPVASSPQDTAQVSGTAKRDANWENFHGGSTGSNPVGGAT
jgi:integrase